MPLPDEIVQSLPEELRGSSAVQKYNDVGSLVKGFSEMESYQGRSVAIPGNDPKELEAWKTQHLPKLQHVFADRMPPAKADDYEFKFDGMADEVIKSDKTLGVFREKAHQLGLSKTQAAGLVETFAKDILPALLPAKGAEVDFIQGEHVDALMADIFKGESTQRIAEYKQNVDLLSRDIPELKDLLNDGVAPYGQASENKALALGDHPAMVKLIGLVAKMTQTDFGGTANGATSHDGNAAVLEAKDIIRNKENPKYKAYHQGDPDVTEYVNQLMKKGYPGTIEI